MADATPANKENTPAPTPTPAPAPAQRGRKPKSEDGPEMIMVETTGAFGLMDPIDNFDIPHNKAVKVRADNPFIVRNLKLKKLKKV
jgi:hypothetical protein